MWFFFVCLFCGGLGFFCFVVGFFLDLISGLTYVLQPSCSSKGLALAILARDLLIVLSVKD